MYPTRSGTGFQPPSVVNWTTNIPFWGSVPDIAPIPRLRNHCCSLDWSLTSEGVSLIRRTCESGPLSWFEASMSSPRSYFKSNFDCLFRLWSRGAARSGKENFYSICRGSGPLSHRLVISLQGVAHRLANHCSVESP